LVQQDCLGVRGKWVSKIQEYELEIKPTKLTKGQGLAKMLAKGNEEALGTVCQNSQSKQVESSKFQRLKNHQLYLDIIFYFQNLTCPNHMINHQKNYLGLKTSKYVLTRNGLGWRNLDGIIIRCVDEEESIKLITEFHSGFCGGHFVAKTTTQKS